MTRKRRGGGPSGRLPARRGRSTLARRGGEGPLSRILRIVRRVVGGAAALWLLSAVLVLWAGTRPTVTPADAIVVLGAAQYNGRPSPVLRARLDHALELYELGLASHLVLTGGVGVGDTLSEGEVSRRYVVAGGVPERVALVERLGVTSEASIQAAAAVMRSRGLESALLVSDSYHMLRLEVLARRAGILAYRAPVPGAPIDLDGATLRHYVLRESVLFPATLALGGR